MAQTTIQGSFLGDGTVTGVKIGADFISAQTVLSSGLATADELIVSDAGVIKKIAMSVWAAATITLTNKSIDLGTNTLTGSVAEFNAALQSESFATLGGTETLAAKTLTTPTISSTGWTNALHAHAANNSGGTLDASVLGAGTLPAARIAADSIVEGKLNVSNGPTNGQVLTARDGVAGGYTWEAASGGIASVAADTTPQLGGNLDVVDKLITSASNSNVRIQPAGNGDIVMAPNGVTIGTGGSATKAPVQILCGPIVSHRANCLELVGPTGDGLSEPASNGTSDSGGGGQLSITSSTLVTSGNSYGQGLGGKIIFGGKYHSGGYDSPFATVAGLKESNTQNTNPSIAGYLSFATRGAADPWPMTEQMKISSGGEVTVKENASMPSVTKGVAKCWVRVDSSDAIEGGSSYNVDSLTGSSTNGQYDVNFTADFENNDYVAAGVCGQDYSNLTIGSTSGQATGSCTVVFRRRSDGAISGLASQIAFFGEAT